MTSGLALALITTVTGACMAMGNAFNLRLLKQESFEQCPMPAAQDHHQVLNDSVAWQSLLQKSTGMPAFKEWQPNFAKEKVLVFAMGSKRSGGFSVKFTEVKLDQASLIVKVEQLSPTPGSMNTAVLTNPCVIGLVTSQGSHAVRFEDSKTGTKL